MKQILIVALIFLAACHGEPVPRDYQNNPSMNPADSAAEAPNPGSSTAPPPEPSSGAEGTAGPYETIPSGNTTTTTMTTQTTP